MRILAGVIVGILSGACIGGLAGYFLALLLVTLPGTDGEIGSVIFLYPVAGAAGGATLGFILGGGLAAKSAEKDRRKLEDRKSD